MSIGLLFILAGCSTTSRVATSNVTKPVILGKVARINGKTEAGKTGKTGDFEVEITNKVFYVTTSSESLREGSNKFDAELMKNARFESDRVQIDNIRVLAFGCNYLGFCIGASSDCLITGSFYPELPVIAADSSVKETVPPKKTK